MATVTDDPLDEGVLRLYTPGLISKYGFADGNALVDDPRTYALLVQLHEATGRWVLHHDLLVAVVREFVLPQLDQDVELMKLHTVHNPARAASVDGVPLDLYGDPPDGFEGLVEITPDIVEVPIRQVRQLAERLVRESSSPG